jgi:hypothetical protein
MARKSDDLADSFATDESGGWLTRLLADEEELDGRAKWRLGSWAVASLGAVVFAILASQNVADRRREQTAAADLARQSQVIQRLAKDSQNETGRLAAAVDTLNGDRDRLFARLGSLEQGLESVTGSIARVQAATSKSPVKAEAQPDLAESLPDIPVKAPTSPTPAIAGVDSKPTASAAGPQPKPATAVPPIPALVSPFAAATPALSAAAAAVGPVPLPVAKPAESGAAAPISLEVANATPAQPIDDKRPAEAKPLSEKLINEKSITEKPSADKPPLEKPSIEKTSIDRSDADKAPPEKQVASKPTAAMITTAPLMPPRSILAPPDPAAAKLLEPKTVAPSEDADDPADTAEPTPVPVARTEFGVDLGGANTLEGLRGLWRKLSKTQKALKGLQPIVMVKETGSATQLRLVAGPVNDAAAAARICATLGSADRNCETSVYEGQRLPMAAPAAAPQPATQRQSRRHRARVTIQPEPPPPLPAPTPVAEPAPRPASLTSLLGIR